MPVGQSVTHGTPARACTVGRGWEILFQLEVLPAFALYIGMHRLPEPARWILSNELNVEDRAATSLVSLKFVFPEATEADVDKIQDESLLEKPGNLLAEASSLLCGDSAKLVWTGVLLSFFNQCTGVPCLTYYISTVFNDTYDWTYAHLMITMVGVGLAKLMGDSVCLNLIDWLGRKQILVVGYFLTGVMSCILCILYFLDLTDENSGIEFLILVLMGVYEMGPGCVTWVMLGELFPMKVKDNAIAICLLVNFTVGLCCFVRLVSRLLILDVSRQTICGTSFSPHSTVTLAMVCLSCCSRSGLWEACSSSISVFQR